MELESDEQRWPWWRIAALVAVCAVFLAGVSVFGTGAADAAAAPCFTQVPALSGIPPWGFHTGDPLTGGSGSYARAYGDINLGTGQISGKICQVDLQRGQPERLITLAPLSPLIYHTHDGKMWGYPGNLIKVNVKVASSTDARCPVGTVGHMTMFGSYNGVRSDSIEFSFPAACNDHDHTYHGPQVNAQVPPL
jgi:hypothetical protein